MRLKLLHKKCHRWQRGTPYLIRTRRCFVSASSFWNCLLPYSSSRALNWIRWALALFKVVELKRNIDGGTIQSCTGFTVHGSRSPHIITSQAAFRSCLPCLLPRIRTSVKDSFAESLSLVSVLLYRTFRITFQVFLRKPKNELHSSILPPHRRPSNQFLLSIIRYPREKRPSVLPVEGVISKNEAVCTGDTVLSGKPLPFLESLRFS